jgi:hypothetical protein
MDNVFNYLREVAWLALSALGLAVLTVVLALITSTSGETLLALGLASVTLALLSMKE